MSGSIFDDEGGFRANARSQTKLKEIFAQESSGKQGGNPSLTYQAPKQPKEITNTNSEANVPKLVKAVAPIQLFQFDTSSSQFIPKGKAGVAILSETSSRFSILVYRDQNNHLCKTPITSTFQFKIQSEVYGNFYDETRQNWSICFKSADEAIDFAKHIVLAQGMSDGFQKVIYQDLVQGTKGKDIELNDMVRIRYRGWLIQNNQFGSVFENNLDSEKSHKIVLEEGKVMQGLLFSLQGMKRSGRRLIIIPSTYTSPALASPIPADTHVLYEIRVVKILERTQQPQQPAQPFASMTNDSFALPDINETAQEVASSQVAPEVIPTSVEDEKAKLAARMRKLGVPVTGFPQPSMPSVEAQQLPTPQSPSPQSTVTQQHQTPSMVANAPYGPQNPQQPQQSFSQGPSQSMTPPSTVERTPEPTRSYTPEQPIQYSQYEPHSSSFNPSGFHPSQDVQFKPNMQFPQPMPMPSQHFSRNPSFAQQGSFGGFSSYPGNPYGVESIISQMAAKIDELYFKVDKSPFFKKTEEMSTSVILQNIQRIVDENSRLQEELTQKTDLVDNLRQKISSLHEKNEKYIEENNKLMERRNELMQESSDQARKQISALLEEKAKLEAQLDSFTMNSSEINQKMVSLNKTKALLEEELDHIKEEKGKALKQSEEAKSQVTQIERKVKELNLKLEEERAVQERLKQDNESLRDELESTMTQSVEKLKRTLEERQKSFDLKMKNLKDFHEDEKRTMQQTIDDLTESLHTERISKSSSSKESIEKIEKDAEAKWKSILKQKENEIRESVSQELTSRFEEEKTDLEQIAYQRGKEEGFNKGRTLADSSLEARIRELQSALDQEVQNSQDRVKQIMSRVYFDLSEKFSKEEKYEGEDILKECMATIKETTIQMIEGESDEEEDEEEEDEEEDEEEEEAEEENDVEQKEVQQTEQKQEENELEREEQVDDEEREEEKQVENETSQTNDHPLFENTESDKDMNTNDNSVVEQNEAENEETESPLTLGQTESEKTDEFEEKEETEHKIEENEEKAESEFQTKLPAVDTKTTEGDVKEDEDQMEEKNDEKESATEEPKQDEQDEEEEPIDDNEENNISEEQSTDKVEETKDEEEDSAIDKEVSEEWHVVEKEKMEDQPEAEKSEDISVLEPESTKDNEQKGEIIHGEEQEEEDEDETKGEEKQEMEEKEEEKEKEDIPLFDKPISEKASDPAKDIFGEYSVDDDISFLS